MIPQIPHMLLFPQDAVWKQQCLLLEENLHTLGLFWFFSIFLLYFSLLKIKFKKKRIKKVKNLFLLHSKTRMKILQVKKLHIYKKPNFVQNFQCCVHKYRQAPCCRHPVFKNSALVNNVKSFEFSYCHKLVGSIFRINRAPSLFSLKYVV